MGIELGAHSLSHYGFSKARIKASKVRDHKCSSLLAHFIDRLKEAKDIDGSRLFDNCIVSYGTNLRSGHEIRNIPALLTGGGAKDIEHGQHLVLPKANTPLANYWLTLMQQAGMEIDSFSHSTGIVPEFISFIPPYSHSSRQTRRLPLSTPYHSLRKICSLSSNRTVSVAMDRKSKKGRCAWISTAGSSTVRIMHSAGKISSTS